MTVSIEFTDASLNAALSRIDGIAQAPLQELAEGIGRLIQEQTRRRITLEKTTPEGEAWKPNYTGSPLLYHSGELARSIDYLASAEQVVVGSGLVYARIHQLGGKIVPKDAKALVFSIGNRLVQVSSVTMPARPYLGLSAENRSDVLEAAEDWVAALVY